MYDISIGYISKKRVGLEQSRPDHHLIEKLTCSRHDIAEKMMNWR
jgi:hypothetical protein